MANGQVSPYTIYIKFSLFVYLRMCIKNACTVIVISDMVLFYPVVTGATSGIGKAYAIELARRGLDVVLVGRSEDKLRTVAMEIVNNVGITYSESFAYFLETSNAYEVRLKLGLNNIENMNIDSSLLVCCPQNITNIVNCNMLRGLIINISSEIGVRPHPLVSLYSATKFTSSTLLVSALCHIFFSCVAPFMVSTKMIKHRPVNCFIKSPPAFVYEALNTVGYSTFTSGCLSHALEALTLLLPSWIQMSTVFIRLLRKMSDVSPWENDKQKVMEKEE
uniref:Hydroxysteroid (20-beta) dehydrogenase 2 n=1 Tax=Neogobius melanostomus TaxID=47308 RepID=A0A8C6WG57_9GOBI